MIKVDGLKKRFGAVKALDGFSLECAPGEMTALVGPNGSGKSTALKIIAGVMKHDAGEVVLDGEPIGMNSTRVRERTSYLPQRVEFPEQVTAGEVLSFFARLRRIDKPRVSELISAFGFHGFETKRTGELSGGMLQRLALAVVFMPQADLYILDEATNNLDAEGMARFRAQTLAELERGASVILSTHGLREVETLAHTIAVVSGGRIVAKKRIETFVEDVGRRRKMWITMENLSEAHRHVAEGMGADKTVMNCNTMTVECREEQRIPILNALAEQGAAITKFGLYEPSLEDLYEQALTSSTDRDVEVDGCSRPGPCG